MFVEINVQVNEAQQGSLTDIIDDERYVTLLRWILGAGCWMRYCAGCWLLNSGCDTVLDAGCWSMDAGCDTVLDAWCWIVCRAGCQLLFRWLA